MFSQSSKPFAGLALPNIASRVFNVPLAISSEKAEQILAFLTPRIEGKVPIEQALLELGDSEEFASSMHVPTFEEVAKANGVDVIPRVEGPPMAAPTPQAVQSSQARNDSNRDLGFDIIPTNEGNIGVIPVNGTLVQRGAYLRESSGMTSYQGITTTINNALADERVASILMYVNSPGGEAYGLFELANSLRALAQADPTVQSKPIFAFTDGVMASAAYAIGSSAARVYSEEIATVGSIGVIMVHRERSAKNAAEGIRVTYITSGTQKADGNSDEPLSPETQSRFQSKVNTIAQTFFNTVAASRQGADSKVSLSAQDIAALQAGTFLGGEANEKGLTDGVRTLRAVVDELSIEMRDRKKNKRYSTGLTASPQSKTQLRFQVGVKPRVQAQAQIQAQVQVQPTGGHQTMTQAAAAATSAAQLPSISLFDANGNPVPLEQLFTSIPQFAQMTQQLSDLQTKLADREEKLDRQTGRVETLLTSQEQKDMTLFVNTRLRGLPIQPAHMVSMLMRLKPLDAQLYGEMLTTFTVLARVFQKTSVITQQKGHAIAGDPYASVVHRGEGADTGGQHSVNARTHAEQFISQDGTVAFELTPQIKAFEAAVQKYMAEHQVTELTAIEIVTKERPDLIDAAKNSQGPAAGSLQNTGGYVQNRPGADVYDPNTAPIDAADAEGILNLPEGITAAQILDPVSDKDLVGATAGPDVDQYLNEE